VTLLVHKHKKWIQPYSFNADANMQKDKLLSRKKIHVSIISGYHIIIIIVMMIPWMSWSCDSTINSFPFMSSSSMPQLCTDTRRNSFPWIEWFSGSVIRTWYNLSTYCILTPKLTYYYYWAGKHRVPQQKRRHYNQINLYRVRIEWLEEIHTSVQRLRNHLPWPLLS
jgi:hypothetical protein